MNINNIILSALFFCSSVFIYGSEAKKLAAFGEPTIMVMPDQNTLHARLLDVVGLHFLKTTELVAELAGREVYPAGVELDVECAMTVYRSSCGEDSMKNIKEEDILKSLFVGYESELDKINLQKKKDADTRKLFALLQKHKEEKARYEAQSL